MNNDVVKAFMRDPEIMLAIQQWAVAKKTWKDNPEVLAVNDEALLDRLKFLLQRQEIVSYGSYMDTPLFVQVGD